MDPYLHAPAPPLTAVADLMRREIDRFICAARERCEYDIDTRRRAMRRYHRSWPLLVNQPGSGEDLSAALHSASANGIGFLCDHAFALDEIVLIKLFWHEESALRVPAVVRHATSHRHAHLIGCEFAVDDPRACQASLSQRRWYD